MAIKDADLISLLPRHPEKRSTTQIRERLEAAGERVSPRSIQRRLQKLSESLPIIADETSKPFGWSLDAKAPANLGDISVQEALVLKLSQRYLAEAMPQELMDDLQHYFARADQKLREESLYRAWLDKVRLLPAAQPLMKPRIQRNFMAAAYAGVLRGRVLHVTYRTRTGVPAKTYDIEPLAIVVRGNVTYLVAQFPWAEDITLMALHRFESIRATDRPVPKARSVDLDAFIASGALGFLPSGAAKVHLRFNDGGGVHLEETPIAVDQVLKDRGDGVMDLHVQLPITEQLKWWILGFGERVEVMAPVSLRKTIAERLKGAAALYG